MRLRALSEREFRLLFVGQSLSLVGDGMVNVALPFAVLDLTGSVTDLGFVFAAFTLPLVAFLLVGGVFADRFQPRGVMVASDLTRFASQGLIAVLLVSGQARIWELVVLQAVRGVALAFFQPASTSLTPSTVPPELLQEANALRGLSLAFGQVIGPALGGFVVAGIGPGWAIGVDSVSYAVSALFLVALRLPRREPLPPQPFLHDLLDGWREFTARTWVWSNLAFIGVGNTVFNSTFVLGAAVAKRSLGGAGAWGLILGAFGLGAVIGGVVALRIRPRRPLVTANLVLVGSAAPPALLALRPPLALVVAGGCVGGIGVRSSTLSGRRRCSGTYRPNGSRASPPTTGSSPRQRTRSGRRRAVLSPARSGSTRRSPSPRAGWPLRRSSPSRSRASGHLRRTGTSP